jgi:hypothetical protein
VSRFLSDKVYFRNDGIVLWIEEIVADRYGDFVSVNTEIDKYGKVVDTVYINSNYLDDLKQIDIQSGPDQVYVWSTCGIAVLAMSHCFVIETDSFHCVLPSNKSAISQFSDDMVMQREPSQSQPQFAFPSTKNVLLMRFRFIPTKYGEFNAFYRRKIPYGVWDHYLSTIIR